MKAKRIGLQRVLFRELHFSAKCELQKCCEGLFYSYKLKVSVGNGL